MNCRLRDRLRYGFVLVVLTLAVSMSASSAFAGKLPIYDGPELAIKPPLPIWPSDYETITNRTPTFRMNGRFQATRYRVELARDDAFTDPETMTEVRVIDDTGIAPFVVADYKGKPLVDGQYYWRAFAGNDEGFWTPVANYRTFFVSSEDRDAIIVPDKIVHPRLLIRADERDALRARIAKSEHLQRGWHYQVNAAYSTLDLAPPTEDYAKGGEGQHSNYGMAASWYARHLVNVAFVAFMDDDQTLANKGVDMLTEACRFSRWTGPQFQDPAHFSPVWNSTLETAGMTEAVAVGYDLLYHYLTEAQRTMIRESIVEKGVRPLVLEWADPIGCSQVPRHQIPGGNWVTVCAGGGGVGAVAVLGEHPEAAKWVRHVRNRMRAWFKDRGGDWFVDDPNPNNRPNPIPVVGPSDVNFGVDGGYKETVGYMNYGTLHAAIFLDYLRRTTGESALDCVPSKLFDQLAWSVMAYPVRGEVKTRRVDFGDDGGDVIGFEQLEALMMSSRNDGLAAWLYRRTIATPVSPRTLSWYNDETPETPLDVAVPMGVFRTVGHVYMRNGWGPDDPMAAIKFHQNRGNHDIGTIFLYGAGSPTLVDTSSVNYNSKIYQQHASQSRGHNVVLVNDQSQVKANGKMLAAVGTSRITATAGQLRSAYPQALKSWTRDMVMLPDGVAIVYDEMQGNGPQQFDLLLHPENPYVIEDGRRIRLDGSGSETIIDVFGSQSFETVEQDGYYKTLPRKYARFNSKKRAENTSFLTVCSWPTKGKNADAATATVDEIVEGTWRVKSPTGVRVAVNASGGDIGGVITDGRLTAVWDGRSMQQGLHAVMLDGTELVVDGKRILQTKSPVNTAVELDTSLRAHFWSTEAVIVEFYDVKDLTHATIDGKPAALRLLDGVVAITLPAGESQLVIGDGSQPTQRAKRMATSDLARVKAHKALAFEEGMRTRSSSSWTDGIQAIDGNPNTRWVSMIDEPLPQWLEVDLPKAERVKKITVETTLPSKGRVMVWDDAKEDWESVGEFETTASENAASVAFDAVTTDRLRVVIESISVETSAATIHLLTWE